MKKLSDLVPLAVPQTEVLKAARAQAALRDWEAVVGPMLASKTIPDRYERGVVWVTAQSSSWAQELRMNSDLILGRLNSLLGEPGLFVQIRVGTQQRRRTPQD